VYRLCISDPKQSLLLLLLLAAAAACYIQQFDTMVRRSTVSRIVVLNATQLQKHSIRTEKYRTTESTY